MSGLNDNHKRRLLAAFQQMDKLLSQSKAALDPRSRHIHDVAEAESQRIKDAIEEIREHVAGLLKRFHVETPPPANSVSWILKTNLASIDIAFEDLYPEKMRGYGKMDSKTAGDLTASIEQTRKLLNHLLESLEKK
jgi:hypothetical protein